MDRRVQPDPAAAETARGVATELIRRVEFESLILDIAMRFNRLGPLDRIDEAIEEAIREIAVFGNLERAYLILLMHDERSFSEVYEWLAPGMQSYRDRYQNKQLSDYPWVTSQLAAGETVVVRSLADMPPEAEDERRAYADQDVKSFIVTPLFSGAQPLGCLGFDRYTSPTDWPEETVRLLRTAAAIFAAVLARRSASESFLAAERDLGLALAEAKTLDEALGACLKTAIAVSGTDSGGVYLVNADGSLDLAYHENLSEAFVRAVAHIDSSSPNAKLTLGGEPVYASADSVGASFEATCREAGITSLAAIPVRAGGEVVACLNVSSHSGRAFPPGIRIALEDIGSRIGAAIVRARAEEALRRSEHRYRMATDLLSDYLIRLSVDPDGRAVVEHVSENYPRITGRTLEEIARPGEWLRAVHPDDAPVLAESLRRIVERGGASQTEIRTFVRRDGHEVPRWVEVLAQAVTDPETGRVAAIEVAVRDITDRKVVEVRLRESEALFADLVNSQNAGIYRIRVRADGDWRSDEHPAFSYDFVSDRYCHMFHVTREEVLRDPGVTLRQIEPEHAEEFARRNEEAARTLEPFSWEGRMIIAGETRWIHLESRGRQLEDGDKLWTGVAVDVTERRRVEEAQREREALVGSISSNLPGAMLYQIVRGADGRRRFTYVSEAVTRLYGCSAEEALDNPSLIYDRVAADDWARLMAEEENAFQAFIAFRTEARMRNPSGDYRWSYFASSPRRTPDGSTSWDGLEIDITDKKRLEERLRQTEKMEAIGQLAGGIAHDFNNQLTGILGYADLLVRQLEDQRQRRFAESIVSATFRAADLAAQLLAFSRKGTAIDAPVNLHDVIHEVVSLLAHSIDKRIQIRQRLDANPSWTTGDPTQLQSAVLNLGLNARDAMPRGGDLVFATSVEELPTPSAPPELAEGRYLRLRVTDTGIGMNAETQKHLFEPFFTTKKVGKGTGLGLAAVYGVIKSHNGAVSVQSAPGRGSTFNLYLPLREPPVLDHRADEPVQAPRRSVRILLADDEPAVRESMTHMLRAEGHSVVACADGAEALRHFEAHWREIDLVILDLMMPRLSGHDSFLAMRQVNPGVRALIVTGYGVEGEANAMIEAGALGLLQKPFLVEALAQKVAELFPATEPH